MTISCPTCKRPLDPGRPKLKVCSSCGSVLPLIIVSQQWGLAALVKEEAALAERQRAGKALNRQQQLIAKLRSLDPNGAEFYTAAALYLRKRFRPDRTYALFFLFLGGTLLLGVLLPDLPLSGTVLLIVGYLFCGGVGLPLLYHSSATVRNLPSTHEGEDAGQRLGRLRHVASHNRGDPIAALILEVSEEK